MNKLVISKQQFDAMRRIWLLEKGSPIAVDPAVATSLSELGLVESLHQPPHFRLTPAGRLLVIESDRDLDS